MSLKRKRTPSPPPDADQTSEVFRSESIYDRSSTFVAHFSPTVAPKELQASKEFESASHRILGWRRPSNQRSIRTGPTGSQQLYILGSDDDGEKYGGKRLEKVLEAEKVEGAVVVARWYGGVLLGPVRFTHIELCAKEAIHRWKEAVEQRRRIEADRHERRDFINMLRERDQSITTLRGLLAEKSETKTTTIGTTNPSNTSTPTRAVDYSTLSLERLRPLEKAKDASIAFLLKKIDQAEERQQRLQSPKEKASPTPSNQPLDVPVVDTTKSRAPSTEITSSSNDPDREKT